MEVLHVLLKGKQANFGPCLNLAIVVLEKKANGEYS